MQETVSVSYKKLAIALVILAALIAVAFFLYLSTLPESVDDTNTVTLNKQPQPQTNETEIQSDEPLDDETQQLIKQYFDTAKKFFVNSPTFSFDGINGVKADAQVISGNEVLFKFSFYCSHPGYGDRSGAPLPDEKTFHSMLITVKDNNVAKVLTDNKYDELNKQFYLFNEEVK